VGRSSGRTARPTYFKIQGYDHHDPVHIQHEFVEGLLRGHRGGIDSFYTALHWPEEYGPNQFSIDYRAQY
jgi:hypothetical protein